MNTCRRAIYPYCRVMTEFHVIRLDDQETVEVHATYNAAAQQFAGVYDFERDYYQRISDGALFVIREREM